MATLLGAISVIVFFVGIAALIRPIPKLKVRTRANALLVIAASFGIALLSGLFVEADSGGVSSDVKLAQGGEAPIPDYEFVSRAEYVGGIGVKVRVPTGLSQEEVARVIRDAADKHGGNEEVTVWVYREGDDVGVSGYTVAMGERVASDSEFTLAFSDAYFANETGAGHGPNPDEPITFVRIQELVANDDQLAWVFEGQSAAPRLELEESSKRTISVSVYLNKRKDGVDAQAIGEGVVRLIIRELLETGIDPKANHMLIRASVKSEDAPDTVTGRAQIVYFGRAVYFDFTDAIQWRTDL
ncbi:MAG: hypothetical protein C0454_08665 [Parvibaculum sp.]|nr:hypothetical protein [Parvibaculum sp.]